MKLFSSNWIKLFCGESSILELINYVVNWYVWFECDFSFRIFFLLKFDGRIPAIIIPIYEIYQRPRHLRPAPNSFNRSSQNLEPSPISFNQLGQTPPRLRHLKQRPGRRQSHRRSPKLSWRCQKWYRRKREPYPRSQQRDSRGSQLNVGGNEQIGRDSQHRQRGRE